MTVRMDDYEEQEWAADKRGYLTMRSWSQGGENSRMREGMFHHLIGDITVWQFEAIRRGTRWKPTTRINVTHNGRTYYRRWERVWTDNTLSRLCRQFGDDIMERAQQ